MTDSRDTESLKGLATKERSMAITIVVGQEFEFFGKNAESTSSEIIQTADVRGATGELIGGMIGRIFNENETPLSEPIKPTLVFEIRTNAEKEQREAANIRTDHTERQYQGTPLERPVLYTYINENGKRKIFASFGTSETGQNARRIVFDQWLEVEKEDKGKIIKAYENHQAQPRAFFLQQLREAKFKLT